MEESDMKDKVLLFGAMGDIGPVVHAHLISKGVDAYLVPFAQNTLRDEAGYRRELIRAIEAIGGVGGDGGIGVVGGVGGDGAGGGYDGNGSSDGDDSRGVRILVLPIGCPTALARMKDELLRRYSNVVPIVEDAAKVELLDSKLRSYDYFLRLGITVPQRYHSVDDVPDGVQTVFKRDSSFASHGVRMPVDTQGLRNLIAHHGSDGRYLIQERIEGTEYSVDAIRLRDGRFVCGAYKVDKDICRDEARRYTSVCNPTNDLRRTPVTMPALEDVARTVLEGLDYYGVCGFDFIVRDDGTPYLLEANPRLTGGVSTQIAAGFDIPMLLLGCEMREITTFPR